jgi:hypothetical protein
MAGLEESPDYILIDVAIIQTQLVRFVHLLKRDHSLSVQHVFLAPNAPRSPPQLV